MIFSMTVVVLVPAIVVSVVMMLDFMRRSVSLDHNWPAMLLTYDAAVMVFKVVFPAIDISHVDLVDVPGGRVVEEVVAAPFSTFKAGSGVAVSVAGSAVVAHARSPVTSVKAVMAPLPSPICRGPEHAG
jgi:hypothetical protein